MSLSTYLYFFLLCLFGPCTPQDTQDVTSSILDNLIKADANIISILDGLGQKIDGFENKMTSIEETQKTMERRIGLQVEAIHAEIDSFKTMILTDECEEGSSNCSALATCIDAIGQFKCVCIQGYSGDGFTCEDIDECKTNDICGEGSTCINHPGTYHCLCHDGFIEVNNFCTDINECASNVHLCSPNAICNNTKGNYTCQCLPFYYGDGFTCNDCQIELNQAMKKNLLDILNIGVVDLRPATENMLIKSLGQKKPQCARKPVGSNCKELLDIGRSRSGVYKITPEGFPEGVEVYCDQETDGGGWSVILQRKQQTPQLNFVRTWEEYAAGFGDPYGEIWIGNSVLHNMTRDKPFTLRVEAKNLQGESRTGIWDTFSVGSQERQFALSIRGYSSNSTLGDALTTMGFGYANHMKFSTYDRDNDRASDHCSEIRGKGGWWYNYCASVNPTGPLGDIVDNNYVYWYHWTRSMQERTFLAEIQFKIRPSSFYDTES